MNKTFVSVVGILALSGLTALYVWTSHNRFYITRSGDGLAYEVDRKTGQTWTLDGEEKHLMTGEVKPAAPVPPEEQIPDGESEKITGSAAVEFGFLKGSIYNGSGWSISRVVLTVSEIDGSNSWTRDYSEETEIAPLTTKDLLVEIGGSDKATMKNWLIKQAFGHKP